MNNKKWLLFSLCANMARMVTIHQQYCSTHTVHTHTSAQSEALRVGVNGSGGECTIMICIFCRYNFFALSRICNDWAVGCMQISHTNTVFILAKICGTVYRRFVCMKIITCAHCNGNFLFRGSQSENHNYNTKHLAWFRNLTRNLCSIFFHSFTFTTFSTTFQATRATTYKLCVT